MTEALLLNISLVILLLPLLGFTTLILLGKKIPGSHWIETFFMFLALCLSVYVGFGKLAFFTGVSLVKEATWIQLWNIPVLGNLQIDLGIKIDNLTAIMLFVVTLISFLVHIFSLEYMKGDSRFSRYYAYLGIFTFSMLGIVLTHNILMMYIAWELVGISSYLLIGFWFEKKSASDASKKAFLVNRVGDTGMFIGIMILFTNYHTFTFDTIYAQIAQGHLPFNSPAWLTAAGIMIFMGAVGKSAQFPLHVWLPDAMEGPTPVSALIHAATMVAAGVYLIARVFVMLTADAMLTIAIVGMVTSFIAATIALTQNDIKKVLAYSTVSQLGYMVMAMGVGAYQYAFFHLVTHAFFKACLFLGSGSVIYAMHHEQDLRKMGGLRKKMPITYAAFLISTLAISGVPFTSGFLSKDGILAGTYAFASLTGHWMIPAVAFLVALMTAFYMFRLVILTFHGTPRDQERHDHAHESPFVMAMPLVVLSVLSVFFWYGLNPANPSTGWFLDKWVKTPTSIVPQGQRFDFMKSEVKETASAEKTAAGSTEAVVHSEHYMHAMHQAHYPAMGLSIILGGLGILLAFSMYQWKKIDPDKLAEKLGPIYRFSLNKWYIDELYGATFIGGALALSRLLAWFDKYVVDGLVNGAASLTRGVSKLGGLFDTYVVDGLVNFTAYLSGFIGIFFRKFQTGKVQTYVVFVIFSVIILLFIFRPFGF
ncbi:MAG: NADH-quinone oxidoreductase subunit L [Ignavibacteria bacterium]|jgi:NADH-quinone oxidoreductase subunit L|nr:NADH-quinone oxidoreductase subunit L [Ignavibacteria bacterium]MCU7501784.1 NADH-quinone oxidoreductase subunit L [Ignavibacteria bacterium]MCU7516809.1 NADH-quinone oxidoreductase subunit L [Ignavibacteria bacterium]